MTKAEAKAAMALHHRRGISLKAAWAQVRGGRASPGGTRTTRSAKSSNGSSPKGGRVGRIYQGTSTGLAVLSPVTAQAILWVQDKKLPDAAERDWVKRKILSVPYAVNLAVEGATAVIDKKMGQAAALSRGSVTAWAAEALLAAEVAAEARSQGSVYTAHQVWSEHRNGYDPAFNGTVLQDAIPYRVVKHGGQVLRKLRTSSAKRGGLISRLLEPVSEYILRPVGMSW